MAKKIAFIKFGDFSHANARVGSSLRQYFPEYELEVIDVMELLGRNRAARFFNSLQILRYYGGDLLSGRRSFETCYFRTPYMFDRIRNRMRQRLDRNLAQYAFSFQTQSLYDTSVPGLPHFVYTDHTHLTNLYYPGFDHSQLFAQAWINKEASLYRNATRTFTMSQHVGRSLVEHYSCEPQRVSCVFAGSNLVGPLSPLQNANYRNQRILFAGIDWTRKGGPDLVAAVKILQQQHPNVRLTIVGCSPQLELANCDIVGWVPIEQMNQYYAQASIFCLPTQLEPFGIAIVEALQNKLPVVATTIGALPELVENGRSGYLVAPNNPDELARALGELLSDPEKCRRFGEFGCRAVAERYSWDAVGRRLRQEIEAAMGDVRHMSKVLRHEIETELDFILKAWFPRTIDRECGGFLSDFDYRWRPRGQQHKMLEYQARQTIAAAKGGARSKDLHGTALHGFRYLKEKLWDANCGGWFRLLDRSGTPLEDGTKHGHGSSYAISACVYCYELTAELACLELAKAAFAWLDEHAHDNVHGGYFVYYQRDGCPILANDQAGINGKLRDAIGTPIGCKDANTTSDLLKAFSDLYRVWPDALLKQRLQELLRIVRDRLVVAPGLMHMYTLPDWTPLPDFVRYGQVVRSASHLLAAAKTLDGVVDPLTSGVAKAMVDMMVRVAWDKQKGGFHLAGSSFGPINLENITVFIPTKSWWPQADGMRAFLEMAHLHPSEAAHYLALSEQLWRYIKDYVMDLRYGGWLAAGLDTNPKARKQPKASIWKDCSHEVEALVDCLSMLA